MMDGPKETLHTYLKEQREAVVWKLDGLTERQVRMPMTPTGTNLLGLVKHLGCVEFGYFGPTFGRPHGESLPWDDPEAGPNDDLFATAAESREEVVDFYRRSWALADSTIQDLDLDAVGEVAWWSPATRQVTLHQVLVHVAVETARHAGHADIVRELTDGAAGIRDGRSNLPAEDADWWAAHVAKLRSIAESS